MRDSWETRRLEGEGSSLLLRLTICGRARRAVGVRVAVRTRIVTSCDEDERRDRGSETSLDGQKRHPDVQSRKRTDAPTDPQP
eukprot:1102821-Rhodomonas_salina.1